jgi:hypothetical protein
MTISRTISKLCMNEREPTQTTRNPYDDSIQAMYLDSPAKRLCILDHRELGDSHSHVLSHPWRHHVPAHSGAAS